MRCSSRVAFLTLAVFVGVMNADAAGDDREPQVKITTKRDTDSVKVNVEKDKIALSIHCPVGISQAVIERTGEKWPGSVVLRLHLKGLESFRVTNGKITLDAAVSSHNDKQRVRLWKDGKENSPLNIKSPLWMEIRMVGGDGKLANTIPLKDGYFEMQLPKPIFEDNPKSITLNWIDFYRR